MLYQAFILLSVGVATSLATGLERHYYLAAVEVDWDYAPSGQDQVNLSGKNSDSDKFLTHGHDRVGRVYKKAVYKRFTDTTYSHEIASPPWQGIVGPTLRAEVGDVMVVHFRNMASRHFTVHPHGMKYLKEHEGALYLDNTDGFKKTDDMVAPGHDYLYIWNITNNFAPAKDDPNCIVWAYHSHIITPRDTNSGLIGALITCKPGVLKPDGSRKDVDREFVLLSKIFDENLSWYLEDNLQKCGDPLRCISLKNNEDQDFVESNLKYSLNGLMYGNLPSFPTCSGDNVAWYFMGMGNEPDMHSISINGQVMEFQQRRVDVVVVLPASFYTASMVPVSVGRWLINCQVSKHYSGGMLAFLDVRACSTPVQPDFMRNRNQARTYYLGIEETVWDYIPLGRNEFDGDALWINETAAADQLDSGPHRIGRRFKKALFYQYNDGTFAIKLRRNPSEIHLGLLGPVIRAEEGDVVHVVVKNMASRAYSFLPHGVYYEKSSEGAVYNNGKVITGTTVNPGQVTVYHFYVPDLAHNDPACIILPYQSALNHGRDLHSGLVGPLVICRRGTFSTFSNRIPWDREFFLYFSVIDENLSWYIDENIRHFTTDPAGVDINDEDFVISNLRHSVNGYMFGNLPGLEMCVSERVAWHIFSMGNEFDVHSVYFHGHTFERTGHTSDTQPLFASMARTVEMSTLNPGRWALVCRTEFHYRTGMKALYEVRMCGNSLPLPLPTTNHVRRYYIAAEEILWDYAPLKRSLVTGEDLLGKDSDGRIFVKHDNMFIGSKYKKAVFRQYTDPTFTSRTPRTLEDEHLDLLGPMIKAEVGDIIEVVFYNKASRPYSIHPHGLLYGKKDEGQNYNDNSTKQGGSVQPHTQHVYQWIVLPHSGPGPNDPNCIPWMYYSGVDPVRDTYSGLSGPLIICRNNILDFDGRRRDVDREFSLLFFIEDENQSWYLKENIARYAPGRLGTRYQDDGDFEESNLMHSINGRIYSNNNGLIMEYNQVTAWYILSLGGDKDIHTVHFHGQTYLHKSSGLHRGDVVDTSPATFHAVEIYTDNPGTWILHCHVNDHITAGMETVYTILPKGMQIDVSRHIKLHGPY